MTRVTSSVQPSIVISIDKESRVIATSKNVLSVLGQQQTNPSLSKLAGVYNTRIKSKGRQKPKRAGPCPLPKNIH